MSQSPLSFTFSSSLLRVVLRDGESWFVAADLLATLSLDRKAMERLDDDEKGVSSIHTPGGEQEMSLVNESGLYSLILGSRKPEAKKFKKWVTSEVLPAIRKTGRYEHPAAAAIAPEPLSASDLRNLSRIVYLIAHWFRTEATWVQAIWFALRRATGVPAPQPFNVGHLPAIAAELRRIWVVADALHHAQTEAEALLIKRVVRQAHDAEPYLAESRAKMLAAANREYHEFTGILRQWNEGELLHLATRRPGPRDYPGTEEMRLPGLWA